MTSDYITATILGPVSIYGVGYFGGETVSVDPVTFRNLEKKGKLRSANVQTSESAKEEEPSPPSDLSPFAPSHSPEAPAGVPSSEDVPGEAPATTREGACAPQTPAKRRRR